MNFMIEALFQSFTLLSPRPPSFFWQAYLLPSYSDSTSALSSYFPKKLIETLLNCDNNLLGKDEDIYYTRNFVYCIRQIVAIEVYQQKIISVSLKVLIPINWLINPRIFM